MTRRKSLAELVRERAWAIHRRRCECGWPCQGPDRGEREQAAQKVMGGFLPERARAAGEGRPS